MSVEFAAEIVPSVVGPSGDLSARVSVAQPSYAPRHSMAVTAPPVLRLVPNAVDPDTDERSRRISANGELDVARRLDRLGAEWKVLHAVPFGTRSSILDHVVIGPAGVFTVSARNHPQARVSVHGDTVLVDGGEQPHVRNSRHEAARAARLLGEAAGTAVEVRGIIAVVGAHRGFTVTEQPADGRVTVVPRTELLWHLRELPARLDAATVARIYDAARGLPAWQSGSVTS